MPVIYSSQVEHFTRAPVQPTAPRSLNEIQQENEYLN